MTGEIDVARCSLLGARVKKQDFDGIAMLEIVDPAIFIGVEMGWTEIDSFVEQ